ncbi:translation initiation factor IF-1, partial [Dysosmobacter welbionis]
HRRLMVTGGSTQMGKELTIQTASQRQRLQLEESEVSSESCFVELPSHYESIWQPSADLIAHVQIGDAAVDLYA